MSDKAELLTRKSGAWIVRDAVNSDDWNVVFAIDEHHACARGCDKLGYDLHDLAMLYLDPHSAVRVERRPDLDRYDGAADGAREAVEDSEEEDGEVDDAG